MLLTGTKISFRLWIGEHSTANLIWQQNESDAASNFVVDYIYPNCSGGPLGDGQASMSLYQEVAYIYGGYWPQEFPRWDFLFNQTSWESGNNQVTVLPDSDYSNGGAFSTGTTPTSPTGYYMDLTYSTYVIRVANEAFMMNWTTDAISLQAGGSSDTVYGGMIAVGDNSPTDYMTSNSYQSNANCTWPAGFSGQSSMPTTVPSHSSSYTISAASGTSNGWYFAGCVYTLTSVTPWETTTWIWYIEVY